MNLEEFAAIHAAQRAAWEEHMAASDDDALLKRFRERGAMEVSTDEELAAAAAKVRETSVAWSFACNTARDAFGQLFEPVGIKPTDLYSYSR